MMRTTKLFFMAALVVSAFTASFLSCTQKPATQTLKGKVIDATMNNIMLLTEKGDTLNISTMDADPSKVPGVLLEDKVAITCVTKKVNGNDVLQAVELTVTEPGPYRTPK